MGVPKEIALKERSRNLSSPGPRFLETRCSGVCRVSPGVLRGAERHIRHRGATGAPARKAGGTKQSMGLLYWTTHGGGYYAKHMKNTVPQVGQVIIHLPYRLPTSCSGTG